MHDIASLTHKAFSTRTLTNAATETTAVAVLSTHKDLFLSKVKPEEEKTLNDSFQQIWLGI